MLSDKFSVFLNLSCCIIDIFPSRARFMINEWSVNAVWMWSAIFILFTNSFRSSVCRISVLESLMHWRLSNVQWPVSVWRRSRSQNSVYTDMYSSSCVHSPIQTMILTVECFSGHWRHFTKIRNITLLSQNEAAIQAASLISEWKHDTDRQVLHNNELMRVAVAVVISQWSN